MVNELSEGMKKALKQIGFGVFAKENGFFDEINVRLNISSAQALIDRDLAFYVAGSKGGRLAGGLKLTESGECMFDMIYDE